MFRNLVPSNIHFVHTVSAACIVIFLCSGCGKNQPEVPRIDYIELSKKQPQENDPDVIWYDDFDSEKKYLESKGIIDRKEFFGSEGGSMAAGFNKGDVTGRGNRKLVFGDFPDPDSLAPVVKRGKGFKKIYWRIYVKHEYGWEGSPAKMSRATSIVSGNWQQAMIAHVWSGPDNSLTLDPASGVQGHTQIIKSTRYNDFENLNWLGNEPSSRFRISATEESGYWVLVEASAKLNTPGKNDGSTSLWINGQLEAERQHLNFRGSYTGHGINAVFLESYWNTGSIKTQGRWYDNFVVSTSPIGPVSSPANPTLFKTAYSGPGDLAAWEVQIAMDPDGQRLVFKSEILGRKKQMTVTPLQGDFLGALREKSELSPRFTYFCRVRQKNSFGIWSDWSQWHQPFNVSVSK